MSAKARMAGDLIEKLFGKGATGLDIGMRVAPDLAFGVLEGVMTPGDLGDKIIAGSGSAIGGLGGGIALSKLGGDNEKLATVLDMVGSIGGDFGGRFVSDQVLKGKDLVMGGKGQTPYEKLSETQMADLQESAKAQLLAELGLLPGSTQSALVDPTLAANGLGG